MEDLKIYIPDKNNFCRACRDYECDGIKNGNWGYDMFCAVCIEKQIKFEGRLEFLDPKNYPKGLELELLALGILSRKLMEKQ